jgi:crossover junction endodeoxyribonuclease RuvC
MRILGIDPGSTVTGYGVVERRGGGVVHCAHGTLRAARGTALATRLALLQAGLARVIEEQRPELAVVERVFVAASPRSALVLGQARGVVLATAAAAGLTVEELSAQEIKAAVVGSGRAEKAQVQAMVRRLLALERTPPADAADALAAAVCRAHQGALPRRPLRRTGGAGSWARRGGRFVVRLSR